MKTLVTGATGFVGSAIVRELLKDGVEVKALVRQTSNTKNIEGLDLERTTGDVRDVESMRTALKGCDVLYHAAALFANWAPNQKLFHDINVEGTRIVLSAALEQGVNKVVYTSSVAAVGYREDRAPSDETTEFNRGTVSQYVETKRLGELEAMKIYKKGLPLVIVNPSGVIGMRDTRPTPSGDLIVKTLNKRMPGYVKAGLNFVFVEDVARGHILAAKKGRLGERYILGNQNMTVKDFLDLVANAGGVEPPNCKLSYPVALSMAYVSKVVSAITRKAPLVAMSTARNIGKYAYYDSSKAIKELGMPQTPIKTAVEQAVNWFWENGYVKSRSTGREPHDGRSRSYY